MQINKDYIPQKKGVPQTRDALILFYNFRDLKRFLYTAQSIEKGTEQGKCGKEPGDRVRNIKSEGRIEGFDGEDDLYPENSEHTSTHNAGEHCDS